MAFNRFCRAAIAGTPLTVYGDGRQTRDFTFVGDVVRATRVAAAATHASGRVYNIGGGAQVSLAQALELIEGYAGRPLAIEHLAGERGDVRDTGADTSRARAELGFEPTVPLEDGLREEFEWALGATRASELARA
jgi:UDP-glucose 4-epimerase